MHRSGPGRALSERTMKRSTETARAAAGMGSIVAVSRANGFVRVLVGAAVLAGFGLLGFPGISIQRAGTGGQPR